MPCFWGCRGNTACQITAPDLNSTCLCESGGILGHGTPALKERHRDSAEREEKSGRWLRHILNDKLVGIAAKRLAAVSHGGLNGRGREEGGISGHLHWSGGALKREALEGAAGLKRGRRGGEVRSGGGVPLDGITVPCAPAGDHFRPTRGRGDSGGPGGHEVLAWNPGEPERLGEILPGRSRVFQGQCIGEGRSIDRGAAQIGSKVQHSRSGGAGKYRRSQKGAECKDYRRRDATAGKPVTVSGQPGVKRTARDLRSRSQAASFRTGDGRVQIGMVTELLLFWLHRLARNAL